MFRFENSLALSWFWFLPLVVFLIWMTDIRLKRNLIKSLSARVVPFLLGSQSSAKKKFKVFLQLLVFTLMILALARPQMGVGTKEVKSEGVELIFMLDISNSMLAQDVRPSRLEFAKKELMRLLDLLGGDKVGLVAFAGSSILLTPMTPDKSSIKLILEYVSTDSVTNQGTNFERGLRESWEAFKRSHPEDEEVNATRVIVIASDGEDNEPGALAIADELVKKGVRIFTLAFGTPEGAPIPISEESGALNLYKKNKVGSQIISKVNGEALKKLAEMGRGTFRQVNLSEDAMKSLAIEISNLQKSQFDSLMQTEYDEKYQWFLGLAIFLALIELFLGERKTGLVLWRGRFGGVEA
ncbi:MAG: VWA domain-containing protein [Pseudomonadota bacterium]|nr:VWA domain-containing protein [Pseudomonadota bacterium]